MRAPSPPSTPSRDVAVSTWLFVCAAFVAAMVAVGGLTRLTHSGLSIVEWKPVLGALPPLNDAAWLEEFSKYQRSPESTQVNVGLSLDGFKQIYYVEWFHRLLGRVSGAVVLFPFVYFLVRKRIDRRLALQVFVLFVLGGLQGLVGWLMVKSGLVNAPHVSPYRLTAHLLVALLLFAALIWVALDATLPRRPQPLPGSKLLSAGSRGLLALLAVTITWGGLMAGFHAGLIASTFPTMNGAWIPDGMWSDASGILSLVSNPLTIHFTHRTMAYAVVLGAFALGHGIFRMDGATVVHKRLALALLTLATLQLALGVLTVMTVVQISWASMHQLNAVLLLGVVVAVTHQLTPARA